MPVHFSKIPRDSGSWLRRWLLPEPAAEQATGARLLTRDSAGGGTRSLEDVARFELKFVTAETAYHELTGWLRQHPAAFYRPYPPRQINNVYFDRFDYDSYEDSMAGISAREKVRYRWYGDAELPQPGQLEIKLRKNRLGWKKSYPVAGLSGTATSWNRIKREILEGMPREAGWWLHEYDWPILINRYERDYWVSRGNGIRATIDRQLRVYDQRYSSRVNTLRRSDMSRYIVLEVKGPSRSAEVLSEIVTKLPLPLSRHSKYCNAVDILRGM